MFLLLFAGCQGATSGSLSSPTSGTIPSSIQVPPHVERLAIFSRMTPHPDEEEAYGRLEGAAFQLKELRPWLKIFERAELSQVLAEQRLQLAGPVSEDTAVRVGRLLGVDSVLMYEIRGPSLRDRLFARQATDLPPLQVSTKIVMVESAEVVFHNVVTAPILEPEGRDRVWRSSSSVQPLIRAALDRGVDQTISDLRHAFR